MAKTKWLVLYYEHERGWGRRQDGSRKFDDYDEAEEHITEFNAQNNLPKVPDWYMKAEGPYPIKGE